ncbi:hypothetical protein EJB05_26781, partial [Eragrostis curvula]
MELLSSDVKKLDNVNEGITGTLFDNIIITDDPALAKTFCRRDLGPAQGVSSRDEGHQQWDAVSMTLSNHND